MDQFNIKNFSLAYQFCNKSISLLISGTLYENESQVLSALKENKLDLQYEDLPEKLALSLALRSRALQYMCALDASIIDIKHALELIPDRQQFKEQYNEIQKMKDYERNWKKEQEKYKIPFTIITGYLGSGKSYFMSTLIENYTR